MQRYLFDTNVISESRKPISNPRVMAVTDSFRYELVYTSVLVIAELRKGALRKLRTDQISGARFSRWIDGLETRMSDRILPVTIEIATKWGELQSERDRPVIDTMLVATALIHNLILVTRNVRDMQGLGVQLLNPWE